MVVLRRVLEIELERNLEDGGEGVDDTDGNDDASDDAVHNGDAVSSYAVFHPCKSVCKAQPPKHCTGKNAHESEDKSEEVGGDYKGELCKKGNEKKDDERVGKCDKECRDVVVEQCPLLSRRLVHAFCRVGAEGDDAEYEQESASYDLQPEYGFGVVDEIHDKRHAETCNSCVEKVACSGSGTGDQSVVASLVDGALQAENACGAHGGGDDDADNQAFEH